VTVQCPSVCLSVCLSQLSVAAVACSGFADAACRCRSAAHYSAANASSVELSTDVGS